MVLSENRIKSLVSWPFEFTRHRNELADGIDVDKVVASGCDIFDGVRRLLVQWVLNKYVYLKAFLNNMYLFLHR